MIRSATIALSLVAVTLVLGPAASAEDQSPTPPAVTLRIAPTVGETLRFRRTLTLRCRSEINGDRWLWTDYDVVQDLSVATKSSEPGKHAFAVECTKVTVTATMPGDEGPASGSWTSESPELDTDGGGDILCLVSAMGMGRVLAGKTNGLTVDDRAADIAFDLSREHRAMEKETGPSSSLGPSLLEGVAWRPLFLTGQLPETPVSKGTTYTRDVSWGAQLPKRAVQGPADMKVKEADAERVVIECDSVPRLHVMKRSGEIGDPVPEAQFQDGRVQGKLILSSKDGLPIDMTWTISGTYEHKVAALDGGALSERVDLTVRTERVE